jgi:hypothetical protein
VLSHKVIECLDTGHANKYYSAQLLFIVALNGEVNETCVGAESVSEQFSEAGIELRSSRTTRAVLYREIVPMGN